MPSSTSTPTPEPTPTRLPPAPVRIRIPSLGIDRAIVELPLLYDERTKTWTRDIESLFRKPGKDLVGHWGGSAYPGEEGNLILTGHNYGYGYNGVFVNLGRLKPGEKVYITDAEGQSHVYQVKSVNRIPWRRKDAKELEQHQAFLETSGPERLTLVTCGGATWAPFPVRVYVVAEPGR